MHRLVALHGQPGWVAALTPLSLDGMIVAASTLLAESQSGRNGGALPWALLVAGSAARSFGRAEEVFAIRGMRLTRRALPDLILQLRTAANVKNGYELQQQADPTPARPRRRPTLSTR
jgi:hypothetical protein